MNYYTVILLEESYNISSILKIVAKKDTQFHKEFGGNESENDVCQMWKSADSKKLFQILQLTDETIKINETIQWQENTANCNLTEQITCLSKSQVVSHIFDLSEKLPPPGCYLLDVFWYVSAVSENWAKTNAQLLGSLKKLKSWHLAEVQLVTDDSLLNNELLNLAARFISGSCGKVYSLDNCEQIRHSSTLWRGLIEISTPDATEISFSPGFHIRRHACVNPILTVEHGATETDDATKYIWIGHILKSLELVDTTTIPLLLFGDTVLELTCEMNNKAGLILLENLNKFSNAGLLCMLTYISNDNEFSPCQELSTQKWKDAVLKTPKDLSLPCFKLNHAAKYMHVVVTRQTEANCDLYEQGKYIKFHCHVLNVVNEEDVGFIMQQEYQNAGSTGSPEATHFPISACRVNTDLIFNQDQQFGKFFSFVLQKYQDLNAEEITPGIMQFLIVECFKIFEENFASNVYNIDGMENIDMPKNTVSNNDPFPELSALRNREKRIKNLEKKNIYPSEKVWSNNLASKVKLSSAVGIGTEDILKCFDKVGTKKVFSSLSVLQDMALNSNTPEIEILQDFPSAIATSYHGLTFNVDARSSEKEDRHCRRLMEKLVKFETYSVGSKSQVPSPATMNINDSPKKKPVPLHTPRKKKKLQKMAEKLYNRRATQSLSQIPTTSMILRSTPTKNKCNETGEKSLLSSPSVHKMSLRSATPTKEPHKSSAKKRICYSTSTTPALPKTKVEKQADKKLSQKTYVKDNKKRLHELVVSTLAEHNVDKKHPKFNQCTKRLYNVSMAFLKDLKSSRDLENTMIKTVNENVKLVLAFEIEN